MKHILVYQVSNSNIALITMVLTIFNIFEYTGKIPIWFTMIGRLAPFSSICCD